MPLVVSCVVTWCTVAWWVAWRHREAVGGAPAVPWWLACAVATLAVVLFRRTRGGAGAAGGAAASLGRVAPLTAIAAAALLSADGAWRRDARCVAALADPAVPLLVRVEEDVARADGWVRAVAASPVGALRGCRVQARVGLARPSRSRGGVDAAERDGDGDGAAPTPSRAPEAGEWAVVTTASRLAAGTRLRLDEATLAATGARDAVAGWRARTGHRLDTLFGSRAPLVRALLVADDDGLDPAVRERFAGAGLAHLLSISGLHVALIAGAVRTLLQALRSSRRTADAGAFLAVGAYVVCLGLPPPALRAATMLGVLALAAHLGRPVHPWTALAVGVAIPALDPRAVATLGWQLSSGGMASLVAARALLRRAAAAPMGIGPDGQPLRESRVRRMARRAVTMRGPQRALVRELVVSTMASFITAPLVAWVFGQVSVVAPLANLAASPLVSLAQPMLFLALVLGLLGSVLPPLVPLARWVADASAAPLALLDVVATRAADLPGAWFAVAPGLAAAVACGVAAGSVVVATARRRPWPPLLAGGGALVVALWLPVLRPGVGAAELHVLDVGQGDALALRTPRGRWILVDAGRAWRSGDAGRRTVVPWVRRHGGDVALFVVTHPDADHVGGAASVVRALRPAELWDPGFVHASGIYADLLDAAAETGVTWRRPRPGAVLRLDGLEVHVLAPDSAWTAAQRSGNDASVVLRVVHGAVSFLLTGDAEAAEEAALLDRARPALAATVLKVGHHGSATSTTPAFLAAVSPRLALVSVGAGNRYGHPHPDVLRSLRAAGVPVLRTDRDGAIVVRSDGRRITVVSRRERFGVDVLGTDPP